MSPKVIKDVPEARSNNIKNIYIQKINSLMKISKDTIEKSEIEALNHTNRYSCFIIKEKKSKNTSHKVPKLSIISLEKYDQTLEKSTISQEGAVKKKNICQVIRTTGKKVDGCTTEDRKRGEDIIVICVAIIFEEKISN